MGTSATIILVAVFVEMKHLIKFQTIFVVITVIAFKRTTLCNVMARNNPDLYHVRANAFRKMIVLNICFVMMDNNVLIHLDFAKDQHCVMSKLSHVFVNCKPKTYATVYLQWE